MINTRKGKLAVIGGVLLTALTLTATFVLAPAVLAQDQATTPQATQPQTSGRPEKGGASDSYLAEALGITEDELAEAKQKAWEAGIQQALNEGLITQAQAEALKDKGGMRDFGMLGRWVRSKSDIDSDALLAEALGITVERLQEAQGAAADARLAQAVEEGRITQEQVDMMKARQALQQYFEEKGFLKSAIDQAVKDGVITQEQADTILSQSGRGTFGFDLRDFSRRGGMRGGRGGLGGFAPSGDSTMQRAPAQSSSAQSL